MADGTVKCKSFVSEAELEALRKKRQEEWEKVRKPDDPLGKQSRHKNLRFRLTRYQ